MQLVVAVAAEHAGRRPRRRAACRRRPAGEQIRAGAAVDHVVPGPPKTRSAPASPQSSSGPGPPTIRSRAVAALDHDRRRAVPSSSSAAAPPCKVTPGSAVFADFVSNSHPLHVQPVAVDSAAQGRVASLVSISRKRTMNSRRSRVRKEYQILTTLAANAKYNRNGELRSRLPAPSIQCPASNRTGRRGNPWPPYLAARSMTSFSARLPPTSSWREPATTSSSARAATTGSTAAPATTRSTAAAATTRIDGGDGDDLMIGGSGDDVLFGDAGATPSSAATARIGCMAEPATTCSSAVRATTR